MRISIFLCLFFVITFIKCIEQRRQIIKNPLTNFRRQVEELPDEFTTERSEEDANINLVAFLVKNAKEIFLETDENTVPVNTKPFISPTSASNLLLYATDRTTTAKEPFPPTPTSTTITAITTPITTITTPTRTFSAPLFNITTIISFIESYVKNVTVPSSKVLVKFPSYPTRTRSIIHYTVNIDSIKNEIYNLSNVVNIFEKNKTKPEDKEVDLGTYSYYNSSVIDSDLKQSRRSCIICNNVQLQECNEPKNKQVPTIVCDHEEDLCYSQQTPFGLIDRGCFNVNLNITTYVCSCNLCNYISISEMPYTFSKRKEWIDNVIDLSRTKNFRTSIYKDMSCLSCEVNATTKVFDMLDNANCLEGNIGVLPTKQCTEDEICGVRALRKDGYIWRGCLKSPLYNYWWSLCDSDLCNVDGVVSLYDDI